MIIYEKMQLIQGKIVETLFFFFQLRIYKCNMQVTIPNTWRSRDPLHLGGTRVPFDIRVVRFVKLFREGTISTLHSTAVIA